MLKNKFFRISLFVLAGIFIISAVFGAALFIEKQSNTVDTKITIEEAQEIVDTQLSSLPNNVADCAKFLLENTSVKVKDIEYGNEKNIILNCDYKTLDIYSVVSSNINDLLNISLTDEITGKAKNATTIQLEINDKLFLLLENAPTLSGEVQINIYETEDKGLILYLDDNTVNTVLGGIVDAKNIVNNTNYITVNSEEIDISNKNSLRRGLEQCFALKNYDSKKPDTSSPLIKWVNSLADEFYRNFIKEARWQYLARGLRTTLSITFLSLVLGLVIGFIVAIIRCTFAKTGKLKILDAICRLYITVMRGTPVMVQLMIIFFVILLPMGVEKFTAAVLCFGINSGAYVAEIVRGGIMSVDNGQLEAGRSLGFNYVSTMWYIVIPQAIKAVLPALANEFIALLKETSVAFYIGVADLTQGGLKIRSITYSNFMPLIAIGLIYLVLVLGLSYLVSLLERRLNKSDRG
ncbi:MAG: amino acid ABC transporter permease [Ruminococcaceae bacterium]|nr:amino acid ABC transporter permease [Oscillospiraceae bacterium]